MPAVMPALSLSALASVECTRVLRRLAVEGELPLESVCSEVARLFESFGLATIRSNALVGIERARLRVLLHAMVDDWLPGFDEPDTDADVSWSSRRVLLGASA